LITRFLSSHRHWAQIPEIHDFILLTIGASYCFIKLMNEVVHLETMGQLIFLTNTTEDKSLPSVHIVGRQARQTQAEHRVRQAG
jgi:hypothetical protein